MRGRIVAGLIIPLLAVALALGLGRIPGANNLSPWGEAFRHIPEGVQ